MIHIYKYGSETIYLIAILLVSSNVNNNGWKVVEMCEKEGIFSKIFDMFVWTSGFQKSLAHTDFNMFVDEWTSANESPVYLR